MAFYFRRATATTVWVLWVEARKWIACNDSANALGCHGKQRKTQSVQRLQIKKFDATKLFKGSIVCVCAGVCVRRVYHRKFASPEIEFYP